jgi:hypothetical protein
MTYKLITKNTFGKNIYGKFDEDGKCRLTCVEEYPPFQEWLQEGNVPEEMLIEEAE